MPEIYQPIYGHEEWNNESSRPCEDRLSTILKFCEILQKSFGRPIRVLDLGCAQGFFSLNIASHMGGRVVGIDLLPENIKVCQLLAAEHPDYKVKFVNARVEDVIVNLQKNQFDLVLGLSVFHHLCVAYGRQNVVKLLAYNDTHLTEVKRPLLLASKYFVYDDKLVFFKSILYKNQRTITNPKKTESENILYAAIFLSNIL